jgi:hypothetical protein
MIILYDVFMKKEYLMSKYSYIAQSKQFFRFIKLISVMEGIKNCGFLSLF